MLGRHILLHTLEHITNQSFNLLISYPRPTFNLYVAKDDFELPICLDHVSAGFGTLFGTQNLI